MDIQKNHLRIKKYYKNKEKSERKVTGPKGGDMIIQNLCAEHLNSSVAFLKTKKQEHPSPTKKPPPQTNKNQTTKQDKPRKNWDKKREKGHIPNSAP